MLLPVFTVPVQLLLLCLCASTYAEPYSPFNRNRVQSDNFNLSPQFGSALRQHPSSDPQQRQQQQQSTNKFDVVYQWNIMDFEYPSAQAKRHSLATG